jgi:hypothetical protein
LWEFIKNEKYIAFHSAAGVLIVCKTVHIGTLSVENSQKRCILGIAFFVELMYNKW